MNEAAAVGHAVRIEHATVSFGRRTVLHDAGLVVEPGEIHGLVGQNGSGKSTVTKVLAGVYAPREGARIRVGETALSVPPTPRELLEAGIAFVHQDLGLIDELSVAENMTVSRISARPLTRRIDRAGERRRCVAVLERLGVELDVDALVSRLTPAERTCVAIGRAVLTQGERGGLLVLDEATGTLPTTAVAVVHALMRRIAAAGGSVLIVSHNLEEVLAVADRVTVLRDGRVVDEGLSCSGLTEPDLVELMLGGSSDLGLGERRAASDRRVRLEVRGLAGGLVRDASFTVGAGEILGITGLEGSGFEDVPYLLTGAVPARGELAISGASLALRRLDVPRAHRLGVALVPGKRAEQGLALDESVRDNVSFAQLRRRSRWYALGDGWQERLARKVVADWDVRPPRIDPAVRVLSGGNQQKVLIGKWLATDPEVVFLHEPTQAVDVGARADILRAVHDRAQEGTSFVIASVDAADLVAVCDRILVFRDGRISAELVTDRRDVVIQAVYGPRAQSAEGAAA